MRRLAAVLLILIALAAVGAPGHALAGGNVGPRAMLIEYYNQISVRNYAVAYQQWDTPPQTYAQFVAGYADTVNIDPHFGGFQASGVGSVVGRVPGVLIGYHADGSVVAYKGCYTVRYNDQGSGMGLWRIVDGTFNQMPYVPTDIVAIQQQELDFLCYNPPAVEGAYLTVQQMLVDYISAVNRGEFPKAYSLWATPGRTYADFVNGWVTTTETALFFGSYQFSGNYNALEIARVPVVMFGYHTDGSLVAYQGCIGVGYTATTVGRWSLRAAYLNPMLFATTPASFAITQALSVRCY
jgi:hypothetical protein